MKLINEMRIIYMHLFLGRSLRQIEALVYEEPYKRRGGGFKVFKVLRKHGLNNGTKGMFKIKGSI